MCDIIAYISVEINTHLLILLQWGHGNSIIATIIYYTILYCGARWCSSMFGALQPEGCGFESTSSRRVGTLGMQVLHSQLLMRFGVKLRFSVRAVVGSASE